MNTKGLFISFEGNEGCGKTTVTNKLKTKLENEGYDVVTTREPGGVRIAENIREVILNKDYTEMDAKTEALLYAAARRQHLVEKIKPALDEGKIVICDRFIDSSLAYQGEARRIGMEEIYQINQFAIDDLFPKKTFLLDIDYKIGLERANKRGALDRLELEDDEFHANVAKGYQKIANKFSDRVSVIDASRSLEEIVSDVYQQIKDLL